MNFITDRGNQPFMNDLLAFAIDAHGGLNRWREFSELEAHVTIDGAIWKLKQQPGLLIDKQLKIDLRKQRITITPFGGERTFSTFGGGALSIETSNGATVERWSNPVASFASQTHETPWHRMHVA